MSIHFINQGMKHLCAYFVDNTPISYADDLYFHKSPRNIEQFGVGQQFSIKSELKLKIVDYVQRNIKLEVTNKQQIKVSDDM
jgi:hypothetical protein